MTSALEDPEDEPIAGGLIPVSEAIEIVMDMMRGNFEEAEPPRPFKVGDKIRVTNQASNFRNLPGVVTGIIGPGPDWLYSCEFSDFITGGSEYFVPFHAGEITERKTTR